MKDTHKSLSFEELKVGDSETVTIKLTPEHINSFASATGDFNPIHLDSSYASNTPFGRRIAHGVLLTGIVSGILGTRLPGLGTVARQMSAKFSRPAYVGETVKASVRLEKKQEKLNFCQFSYKVVNSAGKPVVRGKALVIPKSSSQ